MLLDLNFFSSFKCNLILPVFMFLWEQKSIK